MAMKRFKALLPAQLRPSFVNGSWRPPQLAGRKLAAIKKLVLQSGEPWPFEKPLRACEDITRKGHKHVRVKEARDRKIAENMAKMPEMVEEYRKTMRELRKTRRLTKGTGTEYLTPKQLKKLKKKGMGPIKRPEEFEKFDNILPDMMSKLAKGEHITQNDLEAWHKHRNP